MSDKLTEITDEDRIEQIRLLRLFALNFTREERELLELSADSITFLHA